MDVASADWPSLVEQMASGDPAPHAPLARWLAPEPFRTQRIIKAALDGAGTPAQRTLLAEHLNDDGWGPMVAMHLLEFPTILGNALHVDLQMQHAFVMGGWAAHHGHAISQRWPHARAAAEHLLGDMRAIADTSEHALRTLKAMRRLVVPPLHILRVQALERITRLLPGLRDVEVLEVGSEDGTLLRALLERGARVTGLDIAPLSAGNLRIITGDLMTTALPRKYQIIVATAVFEHGSGWTLEDGPRLLHRLGSLLADGGAVVLENIGVPMPFTDSDVTEAGFQLVPQVIPSANVKTGGRGCVLRSVVTR